MQPRELLIADSCSLILLTKAGLLLPLLESFQVIISPAVAKETASDTHPDGQLFKTYLQKGLCHIKSINTYPALTSSLSCFNRFEAPGPV
ncbi:MAG: hypothetical protein LWW94_06690 [Candidatus Desulfofervidaceae bacterium]|nr:hypothetical protein [Candidatus Desulfofervidaceae bacterium]